jgi:hypothetical protein
LLELTKILKVVNKTFLKSYFGPIKCSTTKKISNLLWKTLSFRTRHLGSQELSGKIFNLFLKSSAFERMAS